MKAIVPLLAVLAVLSGCSIGEGTDRETAALKAVAGMQPGRYVSQQFPSTPKSVRCVIKGDRAEGPVIRAPGICTTLVTRAADGATVVLFRETWEAKDFDALATFHGCRPLPGPCFRPQEPTSRMHTWEFTVTKDGQVSSNRNYGDGPPQYGYKFW